MIEARGAGQGRQREAEPSYRGVWMLLAVLTFARIAYGVQFQSVGAIGPAIVADLGLTYASLGTLVAAYSTLGLLLSLPAGWLIARLGAGRIVLAGLALMMTGGVLLAVTPGFGVALAGRMISGAGAMLLMVVLPTIVANRFSQAALPAAMGTLLAGYPLGIGPSCLRFAAYWVLEGSDGGDGSSRFGGSHCGGNCIVGKPRRRYRNTKQLRPQRQGGGAGDRRRIGLGMS